MARKPLLIFVPGYLGSTLREPDGGRPLWIDFNGLPLLPSQWDDWLDDWLARLAFPNVLEASGVLKEVAFLPPLVKQEAYAQMYTWLESIGFRADDARHKERDRDFHGFAYDWRQDNRKSAAQLAEAIERWRAFKPGADVWLVAHSNGGVVARWYLEKLGGKDRVKRLILLGSPWDGTPKVMKIGFHGTDTFLRNSFNVFGIREKSRDLFRTFPSLYQLLPLQNPFLRDEDNNIVDPFAGGEGWLADAQQRALLADGRAFTEALGDTESVETLCFYGRNVMTTTAGVVKLEAGGRWGDIEWIDTDAGDGTIPERSAMHPKALSRLPFQVTHGAYHLDPAVLKVLTSVMKNEFEPSARAVFAGSALNVRFEPNKNSYKPGAPIRVMCDVRDGAKKPLNAYAAHATLSWVEPLPGLAAPKRAPGRRKVALVAKTRGKYRAIIDAPAAEGYYRLTGVIRAAKSRVVLSELIAVEAAVTRPRRSKRRL
jgi:pimeloyl-ACP methyl ester carboxylesterase